MYNVSADTEEAQMEWITAINSSVAVVRSMQVSCSMTCTYVSLLFCVCVCVFVCRLMVVVWQHLLGVAV